MGRAPARFDPAGVLPFGRVAHAHGHDVMTSEPKARRWVRVPLGAPPLLVDSSIPSASATCCQPALPDGEEGCGRLLGVSVRVLVGPRIKPPFRSTGVLVRYRGQVAKMGSKMVNQPAHE
jgi:hypothetical protein